MLILAIDTALDACSAAVLDTRASRTIATELQSMKRGHAEALMPQIGRVMKESGLPFAALDRVAVTTGPGSFTGLRVGLSAARGIGLAAGKPVVGLHHPVGLCRADRERERRASDPCGNRCPSRPGLFSGRQRQWQFIDPAEGGADFGSARRVPFRRATSRR